MINPIKHYKDTLFKQISLDFKEGQKLLDVGCGDGSDLQIFLERFPLDVFGVDLYQHENLNNIKGLKFAEGSIFEIPYPDSQFDYVFLHDVLHHVDEEKQSSDKHIKALKELKRVCKKNGHIIILEANRYNPLFYPHMVLMEGHNHFKQSYFKRIVKNVFRSSQFKHFEAHVYPKILFYPFQIFEYLMNKLSFLKFFRAYNLAIIENEK